MVHNKIGQSGGKTHVTFNDGLIDHVGELVILGKYYEIIRKLDCGTYAYRNMEIGKEQDIDDWVKENPGLAMQLREEILSKGLNQHKRGTLTS